MSTEIYLPQPPESVISHPRFTVIENPHWVGANEEYVDEVSTGLPNYRLSRWCVSDWKRVFDLVCVTPALVLASPFLALIALAVRLSSSGPVIFCQQRAGQHRKPFTIYKFRTMVENSEALGPGHTAKDDPRITPVGNLLRRFKLDELPQLYNVLRGDMSLVGPRPKLPHHDHTFMVCRPGVTGAATLAFSDEQHILCSVPAEELEAFYQEHVIPRKIQLDAEYMSEASLVSDVRMLLKTVLRIGGYVPSSEMLFACQLPRASKKLASVDRVAAE